ncbi:hypothetical protein EHH60_02885 [Bradyrhizobium sp. RP6]|nr:hypothetical protein EHH60_02885 [Bradyrhizobium sp. RP6]
MTETFAVASKKQCSCPYLCDRGYLPRVCGVLNVSWRAAQSPPRHCERSGAIQSLSAAGFWIASLRSQ